MKSTNYFSLSVSRLVCLCVYFIVMSGLYISPLFIKSPCVMDAEYLPQKPKIFAHRGASGVRALIFVLFMPPCLNRIRYECNVCRIQFFGECGELLL